MQINTLSSNTKSCQFSQAMLTFFLIQSIAALPTVC